MCAPSLHALCTLRDDGSFHASVCDGDMTPFASSAKWHSFVKAGPGTFLDQRDRFPAIGDPSGCQIPELPRGALLLFGS
jgi:hypothetical protein